MTITQDELSLLESKIFKYLPKPFSWCVVPSGIVRISKTGLPPAGIQTTVEEPFLIAKYPITNAQFSVFIDDGGYQKRNYWMDAGWNIKVRENWSKPKEIDNPRVNFPLGPTVGVSWFEANAFTNWLTAKVGFGIGLPTESQWQLAAQGPDNRMFPWGDDFDAANANTPLNPEVDTTPVNTYEHAPSPYGVVDMVGNTSDWTITGEVNGDSDLEADLSERLEGMVSLRIVKGGAWDLSKDYSNNINKVAYHPTVRLDTLGFRVTHPL